MNRCRWQQKAKDDKNKKELNYSTRNPAKIDREKGFQANLTHPAAVV